MFSSPLRASFVALVASAVAISAAPALTSNVDLTVTLSLLDLKDDGPGNMKVVTTIVNTGNKTLKLLKDPRGILDSFPDDTFTVTDPTGSHPPFIGAKAKYSPTYAAGLGNSSAYIILPPGTSTDVIHDLAAAYDFAKSGAGEYSIEPSNFFTYVDGDGTPQDFYATIGNAAKVKLSGGLPEAAPRVHDKRASFNGCSANQQLLLNTAVANAQFYVRNSFLYISRVLSGTPRYTTWFGAYDSTRKNVVRSHFQLISGNNFSSFKYDCTCTKVDTFAYVYPNDFGTIYLCGAFWNAPATGTDSKAGTLVHETSHFTVNGGTQDYVYGQTSCKSLAHGNPFRATFNADSHEYFAENSPSSA